MATGSPNDGDTPTATQGFHTTHWTEVLTARMEDGTAAREALAGLCSTYWYPLYAFIRRHGSSRHDAEDLTQAFFARLLEKNVLASVRPEHGRFRSFLLAALKNFLANDWDRARTVKRGGCHLLVSWDDEAGEKRYLQEPSHQATPEKLYEQSWALTVIQSVLEQLRKDYARAGKSPLFDAIQSHLSEESGSDTYAAIAAKLSVTEGAVKMAVFRLRENFRHRLRSKIAETVADASQVDDELRHLFACLGR